MAKKVKYPVGQQDFKTLRESGCVYVDKTRYIAKLIDSGSKYYFLARPRRFGKSLFLSTLRYFFQAERKLFKGLFIDSTGWSWEPYPVLRLDLNMDRYAEQGVLDRVLDNVFKEWETKYNISDIAHDLSSRFHNIIRSAHLSTGKQVVILVDEYDKPLVGNLNLGHNFEHYQTKLASLYSNFKSCAEHIRFVFLTGVSRFSKLSVFSDLNNINDITFDDEFADICGITEEELTSNFSQGIKELALKRNLTLEATLQLLKNNYDGYRFAAFGSDIYNPWSVLNCLSKRSIGNYWNETGHPTIIAEALKRIDANLEDFFNVSCSIDELKGQDLLDPRPIALLYQTGYLTIKSFNKKREKYRLGIPNKEVKTGIFNVLLPYYVNLHNTSPRAIVSKMEDFIFDGEPDKFMRELQAFFAGISYKMKMDNENNFHNAFYLLTSLIGLESDTEVETSDGRIDLLIKTVDFIYIIELKYDGSAEAALRQINEKQYARPYLAGGRKLFKIGVSFSSQTRCIENWLIE